MRYNALAKLGEVGTVRIPKRCERFGAGQASWLYKRFLCEYLHIDKEEVFDDYLRFLDSDYSATLLSARKRLGYTQKEMAERIGVNRGVYRDYTSIRKKNMKIQIQKAA